MQTAEVAKTKADNARLQREVLGTRMQQDCALTRSDLAMIAAIVPAPRQVYVLLPDIIQDIRWMQLSNCICSASMPYMLCMCICIKLSASG